MSVYVLHLKPFKDCSDISIFGRKKQLVILRKARAMMQCLPIVEHSEIDCIRGVVTKCESARRRGMRGTVPACEASLNSRLARLAASRVPDSNKRQLHENVKSLHFSFSSKIELLNCQLSSAESLKIFDRLWADVAWWRGVTQSHRHFKLCGRTPESYRITKNLLSEYGKLNWEPSR